MVLGYAPDVSQSLYLQLAHPGCIWGLAVRKSTAVGRLLDNRELAEQRSKPGTVQGSVVRDAQFLWTICRSADSGATCHLRMAVASMEEMFGGSARRCVLDDDTSPDGLGRIGSRSWTLSIVPAGAPTSCSYRNLIAIVRHSSSK